MTKLAAAIGDLKSISRLSSVTLLGKQCSFRSSTCLARRHLLLASRGASTSERALVTCATPFSRSRQRWELAPGMVKDSHNVPDGRGRILFSLDPAGFFYLPNMERAHRELRRALQAGKKSKKT